MTIVEAQGNIFVKHANNCKLYGKEVHVGLYLLGTEVIANLYLLIKTKVKLLVGKLRRFIKLNVHLRETIMNGRQSLVERD